MSAAPRGFRIALPLVLLLLAVAVAAVTVARRWDDIRAEPVTGRAGGVEAGLVRDRGYDVYANADSVATGGAGTACVLNPRDGSQGDTVTLRDEPGDEVTRDGTRFVRVGSFTSTVSGEAVVSCIAAFDGMLLQPRGVPWLPWPVLVGIGSLLLAAGVTFALGRRG